MKRHCQFVTLAVDIDLARCPPPEQWDWESIASQLGGAASIKVVAVGPVTKLAPPVGFALAMEALQSDLYARLAPAARDECDVLIAEGQERL